MRRVLGVAAATTATALVLGLVPREASAAPPWVERHLTMPGGDWAFDFGLGIGHVARPFDDTGVGLNLEMAVAPADRVELGLRTGLRFGDPDQRGVPPNGPDAYGRLFDRQYFNPGDDILANPEFRVRVAVLQGPVVDLGVEGRIIIPLYTNAAGLEPGLPLAFHLGDRVRIDTGVWIPIYAGPDSHAGLSAPFDLWIQITPRVWLGPMTGVVIDRVGDRPSNTFVSMGFGFGYQITHAVDFKTMFLFPDLNDDSRIFGLGAGVQIRIE
jgi:hypothetical protein